jgi:hypothetical protein
MKTGLPLFLLLLVFIASSHATEAIRAGECWGYVSRPGEENSYVVIRRITALPTGGTVIGISILGLKLKAPGAPGGEITEIPYIVIRAEALQASLRTKVERTPPDLSWENLHAAWWEKHGSKGRGNALADPLRLALAGMERTLEGTR